MLNIDLRGRISIYEQIKNQIVELIIKGVLKPDEQLPSIRALANELSLNVNTVKRAFRDLETAGVIYTQTGRGSFVSPDAVHNNILKRKAKEEILSALRIGKSNGLSRDDTIMLVNRIFEED